ncbi:MAG: DUF3604 domain-containing protein, partial [Chloroflexi bacterium]|nr:DUF3604 domain-containing protein [Chloroflexota bacterium]
GRVSISPEVVERSNYQTLRLVFIAGEQGIKQGGGLILRLGEVIRMGNKLQFYDCFYQDMWDDTLQLTKPYKQGYVSIRTPEGIEVALSKPSAPPHKNFILNTFVTEAARYRKDPSTPIHYPRNIARRHEIHLKLVDGSLEPGQQIELVLGDTSQRGPGWKMPDGEASVDFVFYVDTQGDGTYRMVSSYATLEVGGGQMAYLEVLVPSTPSLQEEFPVVIKALDKDGFLSMLYSGTVTFLSQEGLEFPVPNYIFSSSDRGAARITAKAIAPGTYRIRVRDDSTGKVCTSNPVVVDSNAIEHIYWGDLHQHTILGKDANRTPEYVLERNRRVELFDFAAVSIHDTFNYWGVPPTEHEWKYLLELNERYNEPGEFVTLHGYEWTDFNHGHRNIYYAPGEEPLLISCKEAIGPEWLRQRLAGKKYLVVPHHTAWRFLNASVPYNWGSLDWEELRLVEIYSKHGSSDYFQGSYPIHRDYTPVFVYLYGETRNRAYEGLGSYAREALANGYRLGFVAGGDEHWARGGKAFGTRITRDYQPGRQAVYAKNLTREDVFDAMWHRHTYATTGARIIVDFKVNSHSLGSEITSADSEVLIYCSVKGTSPLKHLEVWKYSMTEGYKQFLLDCKGQMDMEWQLVDEAFKEDSFYFLHVVQEDGHLAWASPVWVDKTD